MTSGWFCLESFVLTAAISATAFSFYRDRTKEKARRMFYASLLYLPVFMSGLLIHRQTDNTLVVDHTEGSESSLETSVQKGEIVYRKKRGRHPIEGKPARPPVAYASVAPFPFLPAPLYDNTP